MRNKLLCLKIGFILVLIIAIMHTVFIIIGGPPLPTTPDFLQMRNYMRTIQIDVGGGILRTMQDFMDGFNIIVSIFLFTLPVISWSTLSQLKENVKAVSKLTVLNILVITAFFLTSLYLLAPGGTIISGIVILLFITSLIIKNKPTK